MPRPEDEDYGAPPRLPPVGSLSGLDGMFAKTNIVLLILFAFCCGPVSLVLGIVGWILCKDPRAKQNAMIVTIICIVLAVLGGVGSLVSKR